MPRGGEGFDGERSEAAGMSVETLPAVLIEAFSDGPFGGNGAAVYFGTTGTRDDLNTTMANPTIVSGTAIYVANGTVNITDTIVASYTTGIAQVVSNAVKSDYNLFFNASATNVITGSHSFTDTDPLFVDPANDNYHLLPGSPALEAGTDVNVTSDLDGQPRNNPPSIGAYEQIGTVYIYLPLIKRP